MPKNNALEASRAAKQAKNDKVSTKKSKGIHDTDSSSDSDDERATERVAKELKDKERKRRLAEAEAASGIADRMIAEAEAKNQARLAKLAEVCKSYLVI